MKNSLSLPKNNWLYLIFHPITLAFAVSLVSALFIFPQFEPYKVDLIDQVNLDPNFKTQIYFNDINNDGNSEYIRINDVSHDRPSSIMIGIKSRGGGIGQLNYRGSWLNHNQLNFGDFNNNHQNEFYAFNRVKDSLFLNINEALVKNGFNRKNIFLAKVGRYNEQEYDIELVGFKLTDVNNDGYKDVLFVIHAGYSRQPRNFYVYDIYNDSLQASPLAGIGPRYSIQFMDLDDDNFPEVIGNSSAPYNYHSPIPYPDSSSWLMVYTKNAEFLFPPIEFKYKHSTLKSTFVYHQGEYYILSILQKLNRKQSEINPTAFLFDLKGKLIRQKDLSEKGKYNVLYFIYEGVKGMPLMFNKSGRIYKFDFNLNLKFIRQLKLNNGENIGNTNYGFIDLDQNGKPEHILKSLDSYFCILSDDNKQITRIIEEKNYNKKPNLSLAYVNGQQVSFGINSNESFFEYRYYKNPYIWLKFPIIVLIFLLSYLLFYLMVKVQKQQIEKKYEDEKRVQKYQYQGLRNQLDPHFSLNTLNAIQSLFFQKDFEKAKQLLSKYGKLNRNALLNAEKIAISLENELDFVENFLALEKFRHEDRFDYSIKVDNTIDTDLVKLPRMLIHTFAENAIKHGLFPKGEGGFLKIEVKENEKQFQINIEDNGVGRAKSKELKTTNNGKGLSIIQEIVKLYNKLQKTEITYVTIDLFDEDKAAGTRVEVLIPK